MKQIVFTPLSLVQDVLKLGTGSKKKKSKKQDIKSKMVLNDNDYYMLKYRKFIY